MVKVSWCAPSVFTWLLYTNAENIQRLLSSMKVSHHEHTGRLAEKVSSLSLSKSGAIWRINVPKCRREVQIIAEFETPPLLLVCRSKHAATWTRSRGVALRPVNCKQSLRRSLQSVVVNVNKAIDVFVVKGNSSVENKTRHEYVNQSIHKQMKI